MQNVVFDLAVSAMNAAKAVYDAILYPVEEPERESANEPWIEVLDIFVSVTEANLADIV
jgi:hypothetical protein